MGQKVHWPHQHAFPARHAQSCCKWVDCVCCFLFLGTASIQRIVMMHQLFMHDSSLAAVNRLERTLESSRLALLSGAKAKTEPSVGKARAAISTLAAEGRGYCRAIRLSLFKTNPFDSGTLVADSDQPDSQQCDAPDFFVSH